jgi:ribosomal protein S18 acetylase RimI-like enzyme
VSSEVEIARLQRYLLSHSPYAIKLWSSINSWQQQERSGEPLVEPVNPRLFATFAPQPQRSSSSSKDDIVDDDFADLDAVLLVYGAGYTDEAMEEQRRTLTALRQQQQQQLNDEHASAATVASAPAASQKPPRPQHGIHCAFYARRGSDASLRALLTSCLPLALQFMLTGADAAFTPSVLEPLAKQHRAVLIGNPHEQMVLFPLGHQQQQVGCVVGGSPSGTPHARTSAAGGELSAWPPSSSAAGVALSPAPTLSAAAATESSTDLKRGGAPPAVTIAPLRAEHAALVESLWPYRGPTTPQVMPYLIAHKETRAVYVNDQPICWALEQTYGGMGMLHTLEEFRGHGYAKMCVQALSAALLEAGRPCVCAFVSPSNAASRATFRALGFAPSHLADWISWVPDVYASPPPPGH